MDTNVQAIGEIDCTILDSLGEGVYITDLDRTILYWNKAAERITGWQAKDIAGTSCFDDVLCHTDIDGHKLCGKDFCPLHRAIIQDRTSRLPQIVFAKTAQGERIPVEVTVAPVRKADGTVIGGIESFRDLSPLLRDLERARLIQTASMAWHVKPDPRASFAVRTVPLEYVSGDFSRVERLDKDRYVFMVADVMGHGVAAALHTMQITSLWLEEQSLLDDPQAFMQRLNAVLFQLTPEEDFFASAVLGVFHAEKGDVDYVVAGHPAPLLCRKGSSTPLAGHDPALGLIPDSRYTTHRAHLEAGDSLLLYSDGCIEILGPDNEELGIEGLAAFLPQTYGDPPQAIVDHLVEQLLRYSGSLRFGDDVTLLCLQAPSERSLRQALGRGIHAPLQRTADPA